MYFYASTIKSCDLQRTQPSLKQTRSNDVSW